MTDAPLSNDELRQFRYIVEQVQASILITDCDGKIEYANPFCLALTGYRLDELLGQNPRILKSGHTSAETYQALWQTISAGQTWHGEFHNRKKSGETYWESATIGPLRDAEGRIRSFIAVNKDITAEKAAEASLKRADERFRAIVHTARDGIVTIDALGAITLWNEAAERIFGVPRADALGREISFVIPSRLRDAHRRGLQRFIATGQSTIMGQVIRQTGLHADGREFPIELSLTCWETSGGVEFGAIIGDLSQREQADRELRTLARAMEYAGESMEITDLEERVLYVNPAFLRLTGYRDDEVLGQPVGALLQSDLDSPEAITTLDAERRRGEVVSGRLIMRRRDGLSIPTLVTIAPVRDDEGVIFGYVGLRRDIGEVLRAEAAERETIAAQTRAEVERQQAQEMAAAYDELNVAHSQLREISAQLARAEKLAVLGELAANVAHEIRNPMVAIVSCIDFLMDDLASAAGTGETISQRWPDYLQRMAMAGQRCTEVVDNLLSVSRRARTAAATVPLATLVDSASELLRAVLDGQGTVLNCAISAELFVMGHADELRQVVVNLLLNAAQALKRGGRIEVTATSQDGQTRLSVRDDGPGIPSADLDFVFEAFYTTKTGPGNAGLGLAVARRIIAAHGGRIAVESTPCVATTFTVILPSRLPTSTDGG